MEIFAILLLGIVCGFLFGCGLIAFCAFVLSIFEFMLNLIGSFVCFLTKAIKFLKEKGAKNGI